MKGIILAILIGAWLAGIAALVIAQFVTVTVP